MSGTVNNFQRFGGLVGYNDNSSTVSKCYSTGNVSVENNCYRVGGLIGNNHSASVTDCYSTGNVSAGTGSTSIGGLVGNNYIASVTDCYSTGNVSAGTGSTSIGGLVGNNFTNATVTDCYSTGNVSTGTGSTSVGGLVGQNSSTVNTSFWNYETSGLYISAGGSCRSIDSMKMQCTFIDAGWSGSIWYMDAGADFNDGYPYLAWQNTGGTPLPVELSSFTASVNKNDITLNWTTVWEINNAGFDVERQSLASKKDLWIKIGFVEGKGTTNEPTNYRFADKKLNTGKYNYRLVQRDYNNRGVEHFLSDAVTVGVPKKYAISQNYPNPFNPTTKIDYELPHDGKVNIVLYDITGREIDRIVNKVHTAGYYTAEFNASHLASGVYFYRIIAKSGKNDFIMTKKMILIK